MQAKYDGACQALPEGCLRVFLSVRIVSECVRQMSGVCGCLRNWNQLNKYHDNQILLFLPVAACRPNMGVSEGCLDGVWGCLAVSGWCLSVSGRCLDLKSNEIFLLLSYNLHTAFSFSARFRRKQAKKGQLKMRFCKVRSPQIKRCKKTNWL